MSSHLREVDGELDGVSMDCDPPHSHPILHLQECLFHGSKGVNLLGRGKTGNVYSASLGFVHRVPPSHEIFCVSLCLIVCVQMYVHFSPVDTLIDVRVYYSCMHVWMRFCMRVFVCVCVFMCFIVCV